MDCKQKTYEIKITYCDDREDEYLLIFGIKHSLTFTYREAVPNVKLYSTGRKYINVCDLT